MKIKITKVERLKPMPYQEDECAECEELREKVRELEEYNNKFAAHRPQKDWREHFEEWKKQHNEEAGDE